MEVEKQRVLEAMKSCPDAKKVLCVLFPELNDSVECPPIGAGYIGTHGGFYMSLGDSEQAKAMYKLSYPYSTYEAVRYGIKLDQPGKGEVRYGPVGSFVQVIDIEKGEGKVR